ncbi:hypothetical protein [Bacillus sp. CECT 9360]|uniref:hypothetical protein n=1 Tax=Bacillus sp. CECT 9360 TaxID=2845821 RepID=UPI001E48EC92|nr:hypothetical protein [Bacillus sp. CECT 9360]CAH0344538.1 hypothetical protein BCI9360_00796 [Bacillus sp. CECT 9360]
MRISRLLTLMLTCILAAGCNQQGSKEKGMQESIENMANNESVQRGFSEGRIHTIKHDHGSKEDILLNTMEEQEMMLTDNELRDQLLDFNIKVNKQMVKDPAGKEQLMESTLEVTDGISADPNKRERFVNQQQTIRQQALKSSHLKNNVLKQNVREQQLALDNPGTAKDIKEISLDTSKAVLSDDELRPEMLKMNIQGFKKISEDPALRTEMARTMLPLLKDPVIAAELQKMIKLAVAQEMKKMQAVMQQQMKQQMIQMQKKQQQPNKQVQPNQPKGEPQQAPPPKDDTQTNKKEQSPA